MTDQPEVDWVESRHRPAPSSDTPSDDRVQMIEVRPGETRPMLDGLYDVTLPASGRPGLTLREAAIEAILIREQDTAFSVVARHIAALFTSLDAIPSAPPVPSEGERRAGGAALIAAERQRQVSVDGWTPAHDAEHTIGELVDAAVCYLHDIDAESPMIWPWPWDESWWKPSDDRIRNLVRAGALIAAEIDRIQRAADRGEPTP